MIPKLPSFPTGNAPVKSISPDWLRQLWRCVEYAMHHPTGDNQTIVRHGEYLSTKGGGGDAIAGAAAAAPAAGSEYRGPFAVSYDDANETVSVYDSYQALSETAGYVSACGQTLTVHRTTINAAVADELFVCLVLYVADDELAHDLIVTREWSDRTQREYIPLAALLPPPSGGTVTVMQYQHGHIRAGFGRVW